MLTALMALSAFQVGASPPAQTSGSPAYNPYNSTAVSLAITGINVLRAGEAEGDEPYLLAYEYGVQIPVIKGVLQRPTPLPLRLVGKASFDGIRSGYDWAKANNFVPIRGYSTSFSRLRSAYVLFGLAIFVFDHDEYNEAQLAQVKMRATGKVRRALEKTLATDPKALTDPTRFGNAMSVFSFFPDDLKVVTDMFKNRADNIVGKESMVLLSKPVGSERGTPEDLLLFRSSAQEIPPSSVFPLTMDFTNPRGASFSDARYRGDLRLMGQIIRHR